MLITTQAGELRVFQNNTLLPTPATTIAVCSNRDRGRVGVTVDPAFDSNRFIYLYYTVRVGSCGTSGPYNRCPASPFRTPTWPRRSRSGRPDRLAGQPQRRRPELRAHRRPVLRQRR
ncbi:MAG: PQQ-dependent sugar dehydrogenase [Acidimicrobiia bacterium]